MYGRYVNANIVMCDTGLMECCMDGPDLVNFEQLVFGDSSF